MKYCGDCGAEYVDTTTECSDCGGKELVSAEELKSRGVPSPNERDTRKFVRAGTAEDPLSSEQFVTVLEEEKIPVFARPRRAGSVDAITTPSMPWWEILVPEEFAARAEQLIVQEKARIEATADEASQAAEEESQAGGS
jgi:hypothetical protein